jgi:hypothetical protein
MRPEGLSLKNSSDSIGNQTRDLPACSAVPQPTVPPRTLAVFGEEPNSSHSPATLFSRSRSMQLLIFPRLETGLKGHPFAKYAQKGNTSRVANFYAHHFHYNLYLRSANVWILQRTRDLR